MNNYKSIFGFTIGPIYEVMSHSQKTRELWFSSYFFSWYVKKLYQELDKTKYFDFLTPYFEKGAGKAITKAGLFPDHIIAYSNSDVNATFNIIKDKVTEVNAFFIDLIDSLGTYENGYLSKKSKTDIEKIFKDYLQTSFVVLPIDKVKDKIVETIDTYLDALERNRSFTLGKNETTCYRCKSLPSVFEIAIEETLAGGKKTAKSEKICPFCFIKYKAHHSAEVCSVTGLKNDRPFPSIGEISASELKSKYSDVFEKLKSGKLEDLNNTDFKKNGNAKSDLKPYHKYMAIVQADGDNLGDTANKASSPQILSQLLFEFGENVHNVTNDYYGEPIYIGGDDVLSFMPAAFSNGDGFLTVIDYVIKLSNDYKTKLKEKNLPGSISFGVHLFYYKSPFSIALKTAREQLNFVAKKMPGKGSLALLLTQHSGQKVGLQFKLGSKELEFFNKLLKNIISGKAEYPHGLHHNLAKYKKILINLSRVEQIDHFFKNRFNEEIHDTYEGMPDVLNLLKNMLTENAPSGTKILNGDKATERLDEFLAQLRFIKFLIGEDK